MLREEFETWLADLFSNSPLITVGIHVTNLNYLEDEPSCFKKLPDGDTEELNRMLVWLNIAAVIQKTYNPDLSDLIDLKAK